VRVIAAAFAIQIVDQIPREAHDQEIDLLIYD
jgi:5-formyltetrahydrofolate cyclo-ligase